MIVSGKKTFKFSHDDKYVDARNSYESAKASHDPNALVRLLQTYPCNAQALLALSDIHMYTGEGQKSADILERCLFSLESSFHAWFWDEAVNGNARLAESLDGDFCGEAVRSDDRDDQNDLADTDANDSPTPNRTFLDALFKHTQALTRRGCHRAALECAKLALSLDATDPTGLLCAVDYFALRCGEVDWLVDFANGFREDGGLLVFPGFAFSTALARLGGGAGGRRSGSKNEKNNVVKKKDKKVKDVDFEKVKDDVDKTTDSTHTADSTEALLRATLTHPAAVVALVEKLDSSTVTRDALWKTTLAHAHFADARAEVGNRGTYFPITTLRLPDCPYGIDTFFYLSCQGWNTCTVSSRSGTTCFGRLTTCWRRCGTRVLRRAESWTTKREPWTGCPRLTTERCGNRRGLPRETTRGATSRRTTFPTS